MFLRACFFAFQNFGAVGGGLVCLLSLFVKLCFLVYERRRRRRRRKTRNAETSFLLRSDERGQVDDAASSGFQLSRKRSTDDSLHDESRRSLRNRKDLVQIGGQRQRVRGTSLSLSLFIETYVMSCTYLYVQRNARSSVQSKVRYIRSRAGRRPEKRKIECGVRGRSSVLNKRASAAAHDDCGYNWCPSYLLRTPNGL